MAEKVIQINKYCYIKARSIKAVSVLDDQQDQVRIDYGNPMVSMYVNCSTRENAEHLLNNIVSQLPTED